MRDADINEVGIECQRVLRRVAAYAADVDKQRAEGAAFPTASPSLSGALRRASMDLTRALAKMRRPE
jgi:hypothetical protein